MFLSPWVLPEPLGVGVIPLDCNRSSSSALTQAPTASRMNHILKQSVFLRWLYWEPPTAGSDTGIDSTDVRAQTFGFPALGQLLVRSKALSLLPPPACLELPEGDHWSFSPERGKPGPGSSSVLSHLQPLFPHLFCFLRHSGTSRDPSALVRSWLRGSLQRWSQYPV